MRKGRNHHLGWNENPKAHSQSPCAGSAAVEWQYTLLNKRNVLPCQDTSTTVAVSFFVAPNLFRTPPWSQGPGKYLPPPHDLNLRTHTQGHLPSSPLLCTWNLFQPPPIASSGNYFHSRVSVQLGQALSTQEITKTHSFYIYIMNMYIKTHTGYQHINTYSISPTHKHTYSMLTRSVHMPCRCSLRTKCVERLSVQC